MINVNIELLKRTTPVKKIEIIENLTQTELGRVTEETILKIVKKQDEEEKKVQGIMNFTLIPTEEKEIIGILW